MNDKPRRKSSSFISIITLLLSLAALSLSVMTFILPGNDVFYLTSGSVTEIPEILIDFTANLGETVHFLYTGTALVNTSLYLAQPVQLQFQLVLDGTTISHGFTNLITPDMSGENFTVPITLAYTSDTISGLQHNLTVRVYSGANDAAVYKNKLLVQTFST